MPNKLTNLHLSDRSHPPSPPKLKTCSHLLNRGHMYAKYRKGVGDIITTSSLHLRKAWE